MEKDLRKALMSIVQIVNENKNHIPPLTNKDVTPFPYEVSEIYHSVINNHSPHSISFPITSTIPETENWFTIFILSPSLIDCRSPFQPNQRVAY